MKVRAARIIIVKYHFVFSTNSAINSTLKFMKRYDDFLFAAVCSQLCAETSSGWPRFLHKIRISIVTFWMPSHLSVFIGVRNTQISCQILFAIAHTIMITILRWCHYHSLNGMSSSLATGSYWRWAWRGERRPTAKQSRQWPQNGDCRSSRFG